MKNVIGGVLLHCFGEYIVGVRCIVESLLEVHAFHSHVESYDECKWRCTFTLRW
jgi:hypothetical protein